MAAKTINAATGDNAVWLYLAAAIPAPECTGSLALLMLAPEALG